MKQSPLVSVLVTPYNQQAYIRQTLDSILMQVCDFEFEVLIGEDCSTDGTREICVEYAANHPDKIVLCLNEQNKGLLNNYFDIFLKARGKYMADCGGDDYWLTTDKLQKQVDILNAHPEVSMVSGNWQLFEQRSGRLTESDSWIDQDRFLPDEFGLDAIANYLNSKEIPRMVLAASCFRGDWAREIYQQHPELFRSNKVVCEDLPLTLGLLQRGPFYFSNTNWLVYRVLDKSISHTEHRADYMKGFAYSAFCQTLDLAASLGVESRKLKPYVLGKASDFAFYAFLINDFDFFETLGRVLKSHGFRLHLQHRFLGFCMQVPFIGSTIRALYTKYFRS